MTPLALGIAPILTGRLARERFYRAMRGGLHRYLDGIGAGPWASAEPRSEWAGNGLAAF